MSTNTTKIKWRLQHLPDPEEVKDLFTTGLLTKEEAREILFSLETEEERTKKSLQDEIKFLRSVIQKLSTPSVIIQTIREVQKPYSGLPWYAPYQQYLVAGGGGGGSSLSHQAISQSGTNAVYSLTAGTGTTLTSTSTSTPASPDFTSINTF